MKMNLFLTSVASVCVVVVTACGRAAPTATPDTQATVEAAVAATGTAQSGMQATVDAAVQATNAAAPSPAPTAVVPSPTPSAEYVAMSEEELEALIDQAVAEATTATEDCATATADATADDAVTQEEVDAVEVYVMDADQAIAYANELIQAYYGLYGELATESLALLQATEQDLAALAEETAAIDASLQEINSALEQGLELAEDTITQLEDVAQDVAAQAEEVQARNQEWVQNLQAERENRAAAVLAVQPDNVASDRQAAVLSAFDYIDAVRDGLSDDKLSQMELSNIAQLGANASASLNAQGGPGLKKLSGSINDITGQLARGQAPQAKSNLGALESALGNRPSRP